MDQALENPNGICMAMDITVGALKGDTAEAKKSAKVVEGLALGDSEYFHGILPQWEFIDEKHFERWRKKQIEYHNRLGVSECQRCLQLKQDFKYSHNLLLCLAGPEWYQELSPQQKIIIDQLRFDIKKDLDIHLTKATQSSLSCLGMRPLPNDSQIWRALVDSFGCPVEFLLVLYELIKPHRKYYSINDRLLLSGVAHLCLKNTLREMHVRFPSPPREEIKSRAVKPKQRKKKYGHVYLVPFTYEWPQRKIVRYTNPRIQKPECPYFSYICEMNRKRMVFKCSPKEVPDRMDNDIKIPCDVFSDHIQAEEYYNIMFKHDNTFRYIILRPRIYETRSPKLYPGVLPTFMIKKTYPPPIKLHFDVKIYNEINPKNGSRRTLIRATCQTKCIPTGRPGQKMGEKIMAEYKYLKNIGAYLKDLNIPFENSFEGGDHPCSLCGGPEGKALIPEIKPKKAKSWIKRPAKNKKHRKMYEYRMSDAEKEQENEIVIMDEKALKIKKENEEYCKTWENLFKNIEEMEKLRLETEACICPDKSKRASRFEPEIDCTCAIWNIPTPPKSELKNFTCECESKSEEELPVEEKCDCKQKAKMKALEACEFCGLSKNKTKEKRENEGTCRCIAILDGCGNCVKQTPFKGTLSENELKEEGRCGCVINPPEERTVTVGYVFMNNQNQIPLKSKNNLCCTTKNITDNDMDEYDRGKKYLREGNKTTREAKLSSILNGRKKSPESYEKLLKLDDCRKKTEKLIEDLRCECRECKELRKRYRRKKFIYEDTRVAFGEMVPVVGGIYGTENVCDCLRKFDGRVESVKNYQERMRAKLNLKSYNQRYVIGGVKQTIEGPIYNILGIDSGKSSFREKSQKSKIDEKVSPKNKGLYKYVISGIKGGKDQTEYIISEVKRECKCSRVYKDLIEKHNACLVQYENYLNHMSNEIRAYMNEISVRYEDSSITGEKLIPEDITKMERALGLPLTRIKSSSVLSEVGTKESEKSVVLEGSSLDERRTREKIISTHSLQKLPTGLSKCQKIYLCNYMTFGENCGNPFKTETEGDLQGSSEELICRCISYESNESEILEEEETEEENDEEEERGACICECPCGVEIERPEDCYCAMPIENEEDEPCICADEEEEVEDDLDEEIIPPEGCTCGVIKVETSETISNPCLCGYKNCGCQIDEICVKECFYGPADAWLSDTDNQEHVPIKVEMKKGKKAEKSRDVNTIGGPARRYVILKTFPQGEKFQEKIIKKLLAGLADDGYPLARLPDCHRLPYFKLWMQFRMKKRWNYADAVKNFGQCQTLWNHIDVCRRNLAPPKLNIYCPCHASDYTWAEAKEVFKMAEEARSKYYDKVRTNMVDFGREFFPTLYPYQFPNPKDLHRYFFAYQPSKKENVIAEYVWGAHEHKNPKDYKSCICK